MIREKHELAGQTVKLNLSNKDNDPDQIHDADFTIEDWWINVGGKSWMFSEGNPACLKYAIRSSIGSLPMDNEVVYGKVGALGHLIHVSELVTGEKG